MLWAWDWGYGYHDGHFIQRVSFYGNNGFLFYGGVTLLGRYWKYRISHCTGGRVPQKLQDCITSVVLECFY